MKKNNLKYSLGLLVLFTFVCQSFTGTRPEKENAHLKEIKDIFNKMYDNISGKSGKVSYVNYEVISVSRGNGKLEREVTTKSDIKVYSGAKSNWLVSNEVCMFQDKQHTFTVIPAKKVVYWGSSNMGMDKNDRMGNLRKFQDTLFNACEKIECTLQKEKTWDKIIKLTPTKKWADMLQIKSVSYYIDSKNQKISRQIIEYSSNRKVRSVEYNFKETDYDFKGTDVNVPVKSLFIGSRDKLNKTYQSYQLIDVRKKK